jgi:membrane dipeptidase
MPASADAHAMLAEHPALDLHADTLMWSRWLGYDILSRHTPPLPRAALGGHVDVPRMTDGGMGGQFFGLVSLPLLGNARGCTRAVHEQIDALDETLARSAGKLRKVRTAREITQCQAEGAKSALLGIEGAHALEGDLGQLETFARRGVRYLGFAHFSANAACYPAYGRGREDSRGLTTFGHTLVERCESLGVIVDLAHINKRGFLDVCARARRPPIVSHTGVTGAFAHWRNIDDEQIRAVAAKGGVVGVIFCPRFVGGDGLGPVVQHIKYLVDVAGEDVPALGSDWDGFIVPTGPLADPTGLPLLVDALREAQLTDEAIGKILRGNVLRVLGDS